MHAPGAAAAGARRDGHVSAGALGRTVPRSLLKEIVSQPGSQRKAPSYEVLPCVVHAYSLMNRCISAPSSRIRAYAPDDHAPTVITVSGPSVRP